MAATCTRLQPYRRVGRSLEATGDFNTGDVVLEDTPLVAWNGDSIPAPFQSACDTILSAIGCSHIELPVYFASAAVAFATAPPRVQAIVADMHVPDIPLNHSLLDLVNFAKHFSEWLVAQHDAERNRDTQLLSPLHILHGILAAKVNAHRGPDGEWRLYEWGSKLAHSCDPNCAYIASRGAFVAIRHIPRGSLITFSYVGGPLLLQPAAQRQSRLLASHLFLCQCPRCRGPDTARSLKCPGCPTGRLVRVISPLIDAECDLRPYNLPWSCVSCSLQLTDEAVQAAVGEEEESIERQLADLTEKPMKWKQVADCWTQSVNVLGVSHWTYAAACSNVGRYLAQIGKHSGDCDAIATSIDFQCEAAVSIVSTLSTEPTDKSHAATHTLHFLAVSSLSVASGLYAILRCTTSSRCEENQLDETLNFSRRCVLTALRRLSHHCDCSILDIATSATAVMKAMRTSPLHAEPGDDQRAQHENRSIEHLESMCNDAIMSANSNETDRVGALVDQNDRVDQLRRAIKVWTKKLFLQAILKHSSAQ